jgi:hypothetical protein
VRTGRDGAGEIREREIRIAETRSGQLRARQVGVGQVGAGECGAGQIGSCQVGIPQVDARQVAACQVSARADGPRVLRRDLAARSPGRDPGCEPNGGEAGPGEGEQGAEATRDGEA